MGGRDPDAGRRASGRDRYWGEGGGAKPRFRRELGVLSAPPSAPSLSLALFLSGARCVFCVTWSLAGWLVPARRSVVVASAQRCYSARWSPRTLRVRTCGRRLRRLLRASARLRRSRRLVSVTPPPFPCSLLALASTRALCVPLAAVSFCRALLPPAVVFGSMRAVRACRLLRAHSECEPCGGFFQC